MALRPNASLTTREQEVVDLVVEGMSNNDVASRLHISPETVKVHMANIFNKTGMGSRVELVVNVLHRRHEAQLAGYRSQLLQAA